ncbi:hypothetical protein GGI14_005887, partial [Coemansia sp. S680]
MYILTIAALSTFITLYGLIGEQLQKANEPAIVTLYGSRLTRLKLNCTIPGTDLKRPCRIRIVCRGSGCLSSSLRATSTSNVTESQDTDMPQAIIGTHNYGLTDMDIAGPTPLAAATPTYDHGWRPVPTTHRNMFNTSIFREVPRRIIRVLGVRIPMYRQLMPMPTTVPTPMPTLNSPTPTEHFQVTALRQPPTSQGRTPLLVTETALPTSSAPAIRPGEHALLLETQQQPMQREQLPLQTPFQFVIGIGVFLTGLLIVNIGDTDDDGGDVVDAAHPARNDDETVAGTEVVDAAQSARTDQGTVDGSDVAGTVQSDHVDIETVDGSDVADAAQAGLVDNKTANRNSTAAAVDLARASRDGTTEYETAEDYLSYSNDVVQAFRRRHGSMLRLVRDQEQTSQIAFVGPHVERAGPLWFDSMLHLLQCYGQHRYGIEVHVVPDDQATCDCSDCKSAVSTFGAVTEPQPHSSSAELEDSAMAHSAPRDSSLSSEYQCGQQFDEDQAAPDTQLNDDPPLTSEYQGSQQSAQAQEPVNTQSQEPANEAHDSGSSSENRHGQDGVNDMAAAAVQQAPVDDDGAVNDSVDEQPAGSAAEPGNSVPSKKTRRSKRGGVKVRARLERQLERQSNMPAEEPAPIDTRPNSSVAVGSNNSSTSRRGNDQRANQAIAPTDSQSRGSTTETNNRDSSSANQGDRDDHRANLAKAQMETPPNRPAVVGPDNSSFSRPRDNQRANQAQTPRDWQPNRPVATGPRGWSSPRRRGGEQANEEPERYGQQSNEDKAPTTAFSSNNRRYNRTKK